MHHGLKYSSGNTFFYDKIYTKHAFNGALNSLFESINLELDEKDGPKVLRLYEPFVAFYAIKKRPFSKCKLQNYLLFPG